MKTIVQFICEKLKLTKHIQTYNESPVDEFMSNHGCDLINVDDTNYREYDLSDDFANCMKKCYDEDINEYASSYSETITHRLNQKGLFVVFRTFPDNAFFMRLYAQKGVHGKKCIVMVTVDITDKFLTWGIPKGSQEEYLRDYEKYYEMVLNIFKYMYEKHS